MPTLNRLFTLEQTIGEILRRIRRLENRLHRRRRGGGGPVTVGPWRLVARSDGALVARNTQTGDETVLAP